MNRLARRWLEISVFSSKFKNLGSHVPSDGWESFELYRSEAVPACTVREGGSLCLCVEVGTLWCAGWGGCMCGEQVVVFAVETFPIWWIVGVTIIDWSPSFLGEVQNLFDAGGDCAFNFVFEGASLGSPLTSHIAKHSCAVWVVVAI